jgi:hypothetical protein
MLQGANLVKGDQPGGVHADREDQGIGSMIQINLFHVGDAYGYQARDAAFVLGHCKPADKPHACMQE